MSAPRRRLPLGLVVAVVLFLALRALILASAFDSVALWMYELYPMGTMAELLRRGIDFPMRFYYDNAAGQILAGWLAVPSFALFGSSYLALKLVPLALGLGTLILVWVFLDDSFGRRAANLGALLFAIAPPTLVKYSVICSGNHFENLFFTMLALVCAYRLHRSPESRAWLFASGVSAGLALFVFLGALIPVGILAGMHVGLRGIRRTLRDLAWALPGFALGIAPLVAINAVTGARGLGFLGAKFGDESAKESGPVLGRALEFLSVHLPKSGVFEPFAGISGATLGLVFTAVFAIAWLACLPGALRGLGALARGLVQPAPDSLGAFERAKLVPLVLYLPLAALAYGLSNFRIGGHAPPIEVAGYRYFLPTLLFALLAIAIVAARWWERGGPVRMAGAALFSLTLFTGLSSLTIVDWSFSRPNLGRYYDGYDLSKLARALLSPRNALTHEEIVARLRALPPPVRQQVTRAIGFNLGVLNIQQRSTHVRPGLAVAELTGPYPEDLRYEIARGGGIAIRFDNWMRRGSVEELVASLQGAWDQRPGRGLIHGGCVPNPALPLETQIDAVLDTNQRMILLTQNADAVLGGGRIAHHLAEGQGRLCGRLLRRGIPADIERVRLVCREFGEQHSDSEHFWNGVGAGLVWDGEPVRLPAIARELAGSRIEDVLFGLGITLRTTYGDTARSTASAIGELSVLERAALQRGLDLNAAGED